MTTHICARLVLLVALAVSACTKPASPTLIGADAASGVAESEHWGSADGGGLGSTGHEQKVGNPCQYPQVQFNGFCFYPCRSDKECPKEMVCVCDGRECSLGNPDENRVGVVGAKDVCITAKAVARPNLSDDSW
jgi:hypothetical protein